MALFVFLAILPLLLFFVYHKSKQSHKQNSSPYVSLFRTHNLPKPYSLINLSRVPDEDFFAYTSNMIAASPSSTVTIHLPLGADSYIFTANPDNVHHILKTQFSIYNKGQTFISIFGEFLGRGMFTSDGDEWKFLHQIISKEFTKGVVRSALETVESCVTDSLMPTLLIAAKNGQVLDLQDVLQRFNLDTVCKYQFGYDPKCLSQSLGGSEFMMAFREGLLITSQRSRPALPGGVLWQIEKFFNVGSQKRLMEMARKMRGFILPIVEHKRGKLKLGLEAEDFLSRLLQNYNHPNDENMIIDFIIDVILAGHDTISSALTWFFWVVATNPKVEDEILREIRRVEECNPGLMYDQVKDMVYMHAALCEAMRLYPPVPIQMKEAAKDDVLPDGTQVRKGTRVMHSIYSMGRSERIWGKDWAEYKPERWLEREESSKTWRIIPRDPYTYPVFNAGPRACLGKEFAFVQMKTLVAHFLNKFKVVPRNAAIGGLDPKFVTDITSKMMGGFPVCLEERRCL